MKKKLITTQSGLLEQFLEYTGLLYNHQLNENEHLIISEMLQTSLQIVSIQNVVITILHKLAFDLKEQQAPTAFYLEDLRLSSLRGKLSEKFTNSGPS